MNLTLTSSTKCGIAVLVSAVGLALPAFADVIDFESQPAGPSFYDEASPIPQTIVTDNTTITGGVILTNTAFLPADQTSVYGTTSFVSGMTNPIVLTNTDGFNNFFFDLLNGLTTPTSFEVADNEGHSRIFTGVASNTDDGEVLVGFASTGTQVTISDISGGDWDFFIDNIHFDEALPPSLGGSPAPDGASTAGLLAAGVAGLAALAAYRRRATA